jgi:hypothetical protein
MPSRPLLRGGPAIPPPTPTPSPAHGTHRDRDCPPRFGRAAASLRAFGASGFGAISVPPDFLGPLSSVLIPLSAFPILLFSAVQRVACLLSGQIDGLVPDVAGPIMDADPAVSVHLVLVALDAPRSHPLYSPCHVTRAGPPPAGLVSGKNT